MVFGLLKGERAGRFEEPTPLWHTTGGGHERSAYAKHAGWTAATLITEGHFTNDEAVTARA